MRMATKSFDVTRYLPSPVMTPSPLPSSPVSIDLFPTLYYSITALKMPPVYTSRSSTFKDRRATDRQMVK